MKFQISLILILLFTFTFVSAGLAKDRFKETREIFNWHCSQCHGPLGNGKGINNNKRLPVSPRDLTDGSDMSQFSNEDMVRTITKGGPSNDLSPIMPSWGNTLSKEDINNLVLFIRHLCNCKFDPKLKQKRLEQEGKVKP
ncbi:MAG: cytochrome c [Nitrospinota bacterium]|nr:cytochrome c [Nitrospinota bacterium]